MRQTGKLKRICCHQRTLSTISGNVHDCGKWLVALQQNEVTRNLRRRYVRASGRSSFVTIALFARQVVAALIGLDVGPVSRVPVAPCLGFPDLRWGWWDHLFSISWHIRFPGGGVQVCADLREGLAFACADLYVGGTSIISEIAQQAFDVAVFCPELDGCHRFVK